MAMAVLGSITGFKSIERKDIIRLCVSVFITLCLHALLFQALMFNTPDRFDVKEDVIAVELITLPPHPKTIEPVETPPDIEEAPVPPPPKVKPLTPVAPLVAPSPSAPMPDILASSKPAQAKDEGNTVPLSEKGVTALSEPSSPSEDERRIDEGLKALAADLSCLNGFSTACAEIRKDVFADLQLTETDKVYTKKYAHTGMPVEFYGMSERQIREKLNLKFAGENGIVIIPGLLALDGDLWDALHGVNKKCTWKIAAPAKSDAFARSGELSSAVRHGAIKDCPGYLPAAKEDRDRRNKFKLKANE